MGQKKKSKGNQKIFGTEKKSTYFEIADETLIRGKFISTKHLKKKRKKKSQINYLSFHFQKLEKEEEIKFE